MLKILDVTARNFMSIGAQTQAVKFDNGQLTLVLGHNLDLGGDGSRNGTGKTTIINALSYGLYGEALTNIKKNNLINKTNGKNMLVTVDFEKDGNRYRIERGRSPGIMRFLVNGQDHLSDTAQGENRETQKEIEKIIGFPHNMFKHIVALNTYTEPFLSMRANDQRAMIEQLLGITELSEKALVLKDLLKTTRERIKEEEIKIEAIKNSNERIEENIKQIEKRSKLWDKTHADKIASLEAGIVTMSELDVDAEIANHEHNTECNKKTASKLVLTKELTSLNSSLTRSTSRLAELESDLTSALGGVCPACNQSTDHLETHEKYTNGLRTKIETEQALIAELQQKIADINQGISDLGDPCTTVDTFYETVAEAYEHKHNLEALAAQYEEKQQEINPYTEQADSLRNSGLQEIDWEPINEYNYLKDHQDFLLKLLTNKDSFIRKRIIDQNIAYLNHRLAHYLEKIGLPHEVRFSSDLSVEITEYGRDLDFDNLSRGERNRLILSLSWAFRDIYESLNHPMNFMCIDELLDSGMDSTGVENGLSILKKMNREQGKNIFLISHKEELVGRVHNVLTVVKTGGFTEYSTEDETNIK